MSNIISLSDYFFQVEERKVHIPMMGISSRHKSLVRTDTNELISVVGSGYKPVFNQDLIETTLSEISNLGYEYEIDPRHSCVNNQHMKLHIVFPELIINDGDSDIAMSFNLHNSYDRSERVRGWGGAIRSICSNGMVFGSMVVKVSHKHTAGFDLVEFADQMYRFQEMMPNLERRIAALKDEDVTDNVIDMFSKKFGKKFNENVVKFDEEGEPISENLWQLYNDATYYISHDVAQQSRHKYQLDLDRIMRMIA